MKIDFTSIGAAAMFACVGATFVIDSLSDNSRRQECDKRGGFLQKVDDSWRAEKQCVIVVKASKP